MLSLHRSLLGDLSAGETLPVVYRQFTDHDIKLARSTVVMVFGRPGGGKSIWALDHAIKCDVPSLYISCDMSRYQLAARAASLLSGDSTHETKRALRTPDGLARYRGFLRNADHLYMAYEKRPSAETLEDIFNAFEETWGERPHVIYIDNMINLLPASLDEWAGLREMSHTLEFFADDLGACVVVLHHNNISSSPLDRPSSLAGVKGKIVEGASAIISVSKTEGKLWFAAVKNRDGKEDPLAAAPFFLDLDEKTLALSDPVSAVIPMWGRGNAALDLMVTG